MSILSGAIGTMKKKGGLAIGSLSPDGNSYFAGVYNAKQYWVPKKSVGESVTNLPWKTSNTATTGTASLTDGLSNSNSMNNSSHPAAFYCRGLTSGGYTWFLPSTGELTHIYTNLSASGKLLAPAGSHADKFTGVGYWSSSENSGTYAWIQNMSGSGAYGYYKSFGYRVRACRKA